MGKPSFDSVYAATRYRVWTLCGRMLPGHAAEDALQEIYTLVYRNLLGFEGRSAVETWVYRIAVNYLLRARKKLHRRRAVPLDQMPERAARDVPPEDLLPVLQGIIDELDDVSARIVTLVLFQDCPQTEVAAILRIPVGTVYSRLARAKDRIRNGLQRVGHDLG